MKRLVIPLATLAVLALPGTADAGKPTKTVSFSTASFYANETDVSAVVTLTRSWSNGTATARVSTLGGTATAGSDYTAVTNLTVTFARGATEAYFQVPLISDGVFDEPDGETFNVGFVSVGKGGAIGAPATASVTIIDTNPPAAPAISAATGVDEGEIDLSWASVFGATDYTVYRGTTSGSYPGTVGSTSGATSITDSGLARGATYYYVVKAVGLFGSSSNSNEASAVAAGTPQPTELVTNGGFENGDFTSWGTSTVNYDSFTCGPFGDEPCYVAPDAPVIASGVSHGGTYSAFLGNDVSAGVEPLGDAYLYRQFNIPVAGTTSFSFWHKDDTNDSIAYDQSTAYFVDAGTGDIVLTALYVSQDADWNQTTADLTPYAGMTLTLFIRVNQDGANDPQSMYVDDVSIVNLA